ncbi:hypothetical protein PYW08_014394 [Mythimna loreyi]|uniref:Uncharacterized protein n=1 Tax=Mythimna loreyi TaxID=667449 RepID=A0ACC2RA23_9NEOP|nr:hypothetical protein PYW08_014394 [Mythimna loreyi]
MSEQSVAGSPDQEEKLKPIETLVFLDMIPHSDNPIKITTIIMFAMPREHFPKSDTEDHKAPRDDLVLFFRDESDFSAVNIIDAFIRRQKSPVCLFSHNGNRYDFPLLMLKFNNANVSLPDDVMCADSSYAFYDIRELEPEQYGNAVRTVFYEGNPRPEASYKLWDVFEKYKDLVEVNCSNLNRPTHDILAALAISMFSSQKLLNWVDKKQRRFSEVEPTDLLYPILNQTSHLNS